MKHVSETELVVQHHEQVTELMLRISELESDKKRLAQLLNQLLMAARKYVNGVGTWHARFRDLCRTVSAMQHIDAEGGP